jgi:D-alanyl-lipoteichoic acid acyltransferase DltB (MBOAT superfamily)
MLLLAGLALYGFITFLMDGPAALLISVMGLKVVPPFDKPWLSQSLADFWSRYG